MNSHLPKEWTVTRLGELATAIQYGYTEKARREQVGPRFLRITDIQDDSVDWSQVPFCVIDDENKEKYLLRKDDLVFARTGATVGKSFLITGSIPMSVFASYLIRVRLQPDIEPKYVSYFFRSADYWRQISESQAGIGQPNVNGKKLAQIKIPVAPQEQQQRIVAEIEKQFSRLDEAVANLKRIKANLKRYKAAVLKAAIEGKFTEDWRKAHPDVEPASKLLERILTERRTKLKSKGKYKEPSVPDTRTLPSLPKSWMWATVDQITFLVTSGSRGWSEYYSENGSLFIRAQDIKTDSLNLANVARMNIPERAEGRRSFVANGDILITITGANVTKSALVQNLPEQAFVSQHVALLKLIKNSISPFLFLWLISPRHGREILERWAYGAGKPGLSLGQIRTLTYALPPLQEQERIVAEVERRFTFIEELETTVQANLTRANRLRQSVLGRAFRGEL